MLLSQCHLINYIASFLSSLLSLPLSTFLSICTSLSTATACIHQCNESIFYSCTSFIIQSVTLYPLNRSLVNFFLTLFFNLNNDTLHLNSFILTLYHFTRTLLPLYVSPLLFSSLLFSHSLSITLSLSSRSLTLDINSSLAPSLSPRLLCAHLFAGLKMLLITASVWECEIASISLI